jgi:hypothetical protein
MFAKRRLLGSVGGFDARCRFAADIIQYYDLERQFPLSVRRLCTYVSFMRAGGAANAGFGAVSGGSKEVYRHFRPIRGAAGAAAMVIIKSLQSICEVRYGTLAAPRWFALQC